MAIQTKTMVVKSDTALAETNTTIRDTVTFDTSKLPNGITYKGLKAVLSFADPIQWNRASTYDSLTVVWDDATHASYASKRPVPQNIELTNEFYWFRTADLDAQVEQYRREVQEMDGRVTANAQAIAAETLRAENVERTKVTYVADVAAMKSKDLNVGEVVVTKSFDASYNRGGAVYIIGNSPANGFNVIQLANGNSAAIMGTDEINIDCLGADSLNDASDIINFALNNYKVVNGFGTYKCAKTIAFKKDGVTFNFNTIDSTADVALDFGGKQSKVIGKLLSAAGIGVRFGEYLMTETSELSINIIEAPVCITNSQKNWTQYTSIHDCLLKSSDTPISLSQNIGSHAWFNENFFNNIKCDGECEYGIKAVVEYSANGFLNSQLEENIFTNIAFENGCGGIYLENISSCAFKEMRTQEIHDKKVIKLKSNCMRNYFEFSGAVPIGLIDFTENNGSRNSNDYNGLNNKIAGIIYFGNVYIQGMFIINNDAINFKYSATFTPGTDPVDSAFNYNKAPYCFFDTIELRNNPSVKLELGSNYTVNGIDRIVVKLTNSKLTLTQNSKTIYNSTNAETATFELKCIYPNNWIKLNA